jgi:hypothetical protein
VVGCCEEALQTEGEMGYKHHAGARSVTNKASTRQNCVTSVFTSFHMVKCAATEILFQVSSVYHITRCVARANEQTVNDQGSLHKNTSFQRRDSSYLGVVRWRRKHCRFSNHAAELGLNAD